MLVFAALTLAALAATACGRSDLSAEERAYALDRELMCPVCDGQTIDQSNAQIAKDMKLLLRDRIAAGESDDEIKGFFVARYGEAVLAAPPTYGVSLLAWIGAGVIAAGGAGVVVMVLRAMRRDIPPIAIEAEPGLEPYLETVDQEIGEMFGRGAVAPERASEGDAAGEVS